MKVLVIGGGGREHALCWKLRQSPRVTELLCAPGNAGIAALARCIPVQTKDIDGIVALARNERVDFVVVAPDDPLALGCVDRLTEAGIPAFGPTRSAARMESSKVFAKELMRKHGIPTAAYRTFDDCADALAYIDTQPAPIVVKADGLALGKGVVVAQTREEARAAVRAMMQDGRFGTSGAQVVVEECMTGPEVTLLCLTDGQTLVPLLSSQDHKRALDGDRGENTGGMGAIAPCPLYTPEVAARVEAEILQPTLAALRAEGITFQGVLYVGLMLTPTGPRVIEYNARFGDPETQVLMPLLASDLLEAFLAVAEGRLTPAHLAWRAGSAACVVLASGGYPGTYETGKPIAGIGQAEAQGALVFHAGTGREGEAVLTAGGRVLGVTAAADTLEEALADAYAAADAIGFEGLHRREDIGGAYRAHA